MADKDEKTEDPTSRQLSKAREEGNIPKSRELISAVFLLFGTLGLYFYVPYLYVELRGLFVHFFSLTHFQVTEQNVYNLLIFCIIFIGKVSMPILLLFLILGVGANLMQVGFNISSKALEPKWDRINPFTGWSQLMLSKKTLVELIKSVLKIVLVGYIAYVLVKKKLPEIIPLMDASPEDTAKLLLLLTFEVFIKLSLVVIVIAIFDFFYQKWQYMQDLKMTKQEVKEEFKQMEGDPMVKNRIRSLQMEAARKRMMEDVPKADVVITNPTHFAVALKYDVSAGRAPVVLAKGQRLMALKIRQLAKDNGVYIHEDPPLARTLFKTVDIGAEIPENLFKVIAEILAFVYKMKNKKM